MTEISQATDAELAAVRRTGVARALTFAGLLVHAGFCPISIAGTQIGLGLAAAGIAAGMVAGVRPARPALGLPLLALVAICSASDLLSPYGPPDLAAATLWRSILGFWIVHHSVSLLGERRYRNAALARPRPACVCPPSSDSFSSAPGSISSIYSGCARRRAGSRLQDYPADSERRASSSPGSPSATTRPYSSRSWAAPSLRARSLGEPPCSRVARSLSGSPPSPRHSI